MVQNRLFTFARGPWSSSVGNAQPSESQDPATFERIVSSPSTVAATSVATGRSYTEVEQMSAEAPDVALRRILQERMDKELEPWMNDGAHAQALQRPQLRRTGSPKDLASASLRSESASTFASLTPRSTRHSHEDDMDAAAKPIMPRANGSVRRSRSVGSNRRVRAAEPAELRQKQRRSHDPNAGRRPWISVSQRARTCEEDFADISEVEEGFPEARWPARSTC